MNVPIAKGNIELRLSQESRFNAIFSSKYWSVINAKKLNFKLYIEYAFCLIIKLCRAICRALEKIRSKFQNVRIIFVVFYEFL
jgi:hypothetical protein